MAHSNRCHLVVLVVAVQALAVSAVILDSMVQRYELARERIEPEARAVAEKFASLVGNHRLYTMTLATWPYQEVTMKNIEKFWDTFNDQFPLNYTTDADAATETLAYVLGVDALRRIDSLEQAAAAIAIAPKPQCLAFVNQLGPEIFETANFRGLVFSSGSGVNLFAEELQRIGREPRVKDFLLGWAHYQICRALVHNSNEKLVYKFWRRLQTHLDDHPEFPNLPVTPYDQQGNLTASYRTGLITG